jgi:hypothetical protein
VGKVITSGLHRIQEVFGESAHQYSQELRRLREQQSAAAIELNKKSVKLSDSALKLMMLSLFNTETQTPWGTTRHRQKKDEQIKGCLGCLFVLALIMIGTGIVILLRATQSSEPLGGPISVFALGMGCLWLVLLGKKHILDPQGDIVNSCG